MRPAPVIWYLIVDESTQSESFIPLLLLTARMLLRIVVSVH